MRVLVGWFRSLVDALVREGEALAEPILVGVATVGLAS